MRVKPSSEAVRIEQLRQLFKAQYPKATTDNVMHFYGWLFAHRPELLSTAKGDAYQHLKSEVDGLYSER